jgi:pimeloyl-ACP methyl ester carboxylesterase
MTTSAQESSLCRVTSHDVELVAEAWGRDGDPTILLMHGGGQTRHAFRRVARSLSALGFYVLVPDLRGHGDSGWSLDGSYGVERYADDVRAWCQLGAEPRSLIGASLGGISAVFAAGEAPRVPVRGLLLIDVAHRGEVLGAKRILEFMRSHGDGFASLEEAARAVSAYLPHRPNPGNAERLRHNLRERDGRLYWHWDPRLLDGFDLNADHRPYRQRFLEAARAVDAPILLVRGGESDVLSAETAAEFCREVPHASYLDVAGARHMVAGDQNDPFLSAILSFVARLKD